MARCSVIYEKKVQCIIILIFNLQGFWFLCSVLNSQMFPWIPWLLVHPEVFHSASSRFPGP